SGRGFVYKLVSVDSLAVYCDEPPPSAPPKRPPASSPPTHNAAGKVENPPRSSSPNDETVAAAAVTAAAADEAGRIRRGDRKRGGTAACRSFLAAGLSDEDLEGMFRTSLADGEDGHSYVVVPASPSFRLRVQRGGDGGGGGGVGGVGDGGSSKYKVEAFFNDVGVVLNNSQIANINKMRSTLRDLERWEALYRHRPKHSIKDGPKAWWVFLVKCVSRPGKADKRAKLGWPDVMRLLALRKTYVRLYTARARHRATPEEYKEFTRLDERLTANEIVAFRLKAIAELEEGGDEEEDEDPGAAGEANLAESDPEEQQQPRQTWGQWLLRRDPAPATTTAAADAGAAGVNVGGGGGGGGGGGTAEELVAATQREDAAAQAEFLRAFAPGGDGEGEEDGTDENRNRVLMDVEVSLNEGALTLVNVGQPCLRIIFDLKAELKKKKTDWRLELGLGALQAFGLGGEGARATTLLTRRTWRPIEGAEGAGAMIQIGDFQVWKSGGVVVDYKSEDPDTAGSTTSRRARDSPRSPRSPLSSSGGVLTVDSVAEAAAAAAATEHAIGGGGGSVVTVKVVFAPHELMHSRDCVDQVRS
ncbi:unnamed protein product, partial [Laminaria digitata]